MPRAQAKGATGAGRGGLDDMTSLNEALGAIEKLHDHVLKKHQDLQEANKKVVAKGKALKVAEKEKKELKGVAQVLEKALDDNNLCDFPVLKGNKYQGCRNHRQEGRTRCHMHIRKPRPAAAPAVVN